MGQAYKAHMDDSHGVIGLPVVEMALHAAIIASECHEAIAKLDPLRPHELKI